MLRQDREMAVRLVFLWCVSFFAWLVGPNLANAAAMPPEQISDPYEGIPALPVTRNQLVLRCAAPETEGAAITCTLRLTVTLTRPFADLWPEQIKASYFVVLHPRQSLPTADPFTFEIQIALSPMQFTAAVTDLSAMEVRHPVFVKRWMAAFYPFNFEAPALRSAPIEFTLELPDALRPESNWDMLFSSDTPTGSILQETHDRPYVYFPIEQTGRWTWGGPVVGIACNLRRSNNPEKGVLGCPLAVIGWEMSYPDWRIYQLRVETNFSTHVGAIPSVEAAIFTNSNIDFGFGFLVGLPVDIIPEQRVGVRALLNVFTWVFNFGMGVDYFPWQEDAAGNTFNTVFNAQLSF